MIKFQPINNLDTFYEVDDRKTYSKAEALRWSGSDTSKIHFNWMEDVWSNVDWTIEPELSFRELCRIRAQQIRDSYDHVCLWYSGGYDSHTILKTFVENNILLDEILIYDRKEFCNDQEVAYAIAEAKNVKNNCFPNLKINYITVDPKSLDEFYNSDSGDWIYHPGLSLKIGKTSRYFATMVLPEFTSTFTHTGSRADISGVHKAKLLLQDNKWYAVCPDSSLYDMMGSNQIWFYFSKELPALNVKQHWSVLRWFESLPELTDELIHEIQGAKRNGSDWNRYYEPWNLAMGRSPITNGCDFSRLGTAKLISDNSDTSYDYLKYYEYVKKNNNKVINSYRSGIQQLSNIMNTDDFKNPTILSKQYFMKEKK